VENAEGYLLDLATMQWFFEQYYSESAGVPPEDPRLSPLRATSLVGQPPAVVVTAEFDPLRDEGEAYAEALTDAGVEVRRTRYDGLIHGFIDMAGLSPAADAAVAATIASFRELLHAG
jgi:acetyl esterase